MNARRLKWTLIIASTGCLLVYVIGVLITPTPRRYDFVAGSLTQKGSRAVLHELGQTNVGIVDGDLFSLRSSGGMADADIGVSVKQTPGTPYEASANKTLIAKLVQQVGGDQAKVDAAFNKAYSAHPETDTWVAELPSDLKMEGARVFILAALPALHSGETLTDDRISEKALRIREVVKKACIAAQPTSAHLAIHLVGEGAAGVPKEDVIPALFAGVNDAASKNLCPPKITFVTYSEDKRHGSSIDEQKDWLGQVASLFLRELKSDPASWEYQRYRRAISQFFLVAIAPMLAGLVILLVPSFRGRLWWGPVAFNVAKWTAIVAGVNGFAQLARGDFTPQPSYVLGIAMLFAFFMPLIDWSELEKMRDRSDKPIATITDHEES